MTNQEHERAELYEDCDDLARRLDGAAKRIEKIGIANGAIMKRMDAELRRLRIAHLRRMADAAVLVERSAEEALRLEQHRRHREWPHRDVGKLHRRYMRLVRFIAKVDDEIARLRGEG